jgi:BRCT domain type II-containing protein
MITLRAPAARCLRASSALVNRPVDSTTTSAPSSFHRTGETSQGGVVLEEVGQDLRLRQIVDADEFDVGAGGQGGPEEVAANTAEAVDANADRHEPVSSLVHAGGRQVTARIFLRARRADEIRLVR